MRKRLVCHIMHNMINEVGMKKVKLQSQEFMWSKRMWPIDKDAVAWIDKKGTSHMFFDVNESDGTIRWLHPYKQNIIDDKCTACNGKISIDAKNTWDLLKRKTINTFWGIDSSHIILLIIMGIVAISAIAGVMYLVGSNTKLQEQYTSTQTKYTELLQKYAEAQTVINTNPPTANLILGALVWQ